MGVFEYLSDNPEVPLQGVQWVTAFTAGLIWGYGQAKKDKQFPEDVRGASEAEGMAISTSVVLEGFEDFYAERIGTDNFGVLDFGEYASTAMAMGSGVVYGRQVEKYLTEGRKDLEKFEDVLNLLNSE
ncbi:MAG: hypothetical protein ABEK16_01995 [Candidatus Nanohalobium sp.]